MPIPRQSARPAGGQARRLGISAATLCHLAWALVLSKVSGREDVVFGTVLFGRMQGGEGADRVMGLFINTLPVRIAIAENGVETAARQTHVLLADLLRHEHASLALAQRCSGVPAPAPLFSALFNYRHSPGAAQEPSQEAMLAWEGIEGLRSEERTNYPFTLSVNDLGEGFSLDAQTPASIGPMRVCEYMRTALEALVEALETSPAEAIRMLDVLPASERHRVLYEWNDTKADFPSDKCVHELFEEQVRKSPDATAVVFEDIELSYAELNRRANQLAHHLRELGVKPDARVAICVERGFEMVVALMAVLKAGGAYVPLDPAYPVERLRFMLEDSVPVALLTQSHLRELFTELDDALPVLDLADAAAWQDRPQSNPEPEAIGLGPNHLAYVIYTSGSTGMPKGVMIEHRNTVNFLSWAKTVFSLKTLERTLFSTSINFDLAVYELFLPLSVGTMIAVVENALALAHEPVDATILNTVPSAMKMLVDSGGVSKTVRTVNLAGEALRRELVDRIFETTEVEEVRNLYGPSETTTYSTWVAMNRMGGFTLTIGGPISNTRVYILDAYGQPVPVGVTGELYIGGAGVARGYLNRPELTAEKFLADPFAGDPEARMYKTGDLGRWLADGNIEFLGRNDFQVKIRGFRIELGEIEARLAEYPAVREAVVIAREDTLGDKRLIAYYTTSMLGESEQDAVSAEQLRSHLSASLPEYMVPAAYVRLESLPLTPNGKLDRKALPAPEYDAYSTRGYEAPQGEIEERLAAVWAEVLKVERVGRNDNFFALGGHSLLVVRLVILLEQQGNLLSPVDLFAYPTVASIAKRLKSHNCATHANEAKLIKIGCAATPIFFTHCGAGELLYIPGLAEHIATNNSVYGLPPIPADDFQLQTIEGMAARMIQIIRKVQPAGPYRIAGYSLGGILAYEIVVQLIGADEGVEFLGLLDTHCPISANKDRRPPLEIFDEKRILLLLAESQVQNNAELRTAMDEVRRCAETTTFENLVQMCKERLLIPGYLNAHNPQQLKQTVARMYSYQLAVRNYFVKPLPIPLNIFAAKGEDPTNSSLGWNEIQGKGLLRVIPVPGTHGSMMAPPQVETVGQVLSEVIQEATAEMRNLPECGYVPLIRLKTARSGAPPVICVPGAGASATSFMDLAEALGDSWSVYGLQPRGLDGTLLPHSTVLAQANAFLQALEATYPSGPMRLFGHSFGGWVAFEMARQLMDSGREIAALTILDSEPPDDSIAITREYTATEATLRCIGVFEELLERPLGLDERDLDPLDETGQLELLHRSLVQSGLMPQRSAPDSLKGMLRCFSNSLRTHYTPAKTYQGNMLLVLANDFSLSDTSNKEKNEQIVAAWRRWAPHLQYSVTPGNHMTALKAPHVQVLGHLMQSREGLFQ